jgi:predicted ATPase
LRPLRSLLVNAGVLESGRCAGEVLSAAMGGKPPLISTNPPTHCDLARLWVERGEKQQAADLLAPVYGGFTEGFDTADVREAKAILDELRVK